jgi:ribulose-5-phosphate 4-epimerase/fuculose-1-phosphate aldolase
VPNYVAGDLRDQLAHVGYSVVSAGLVVGSGGNLSARVPDADTCWVTGAGTWLDRLNRPDFAEVNLADGAVLRDGVPPSTELALHLATYRARPDVHAIVHLHPQTALLLDALGERIRLVSTDHVVYLRRIVTTPFRPPGSAELAEVAAAAADGTNCVLLAHHG